MPTRVRRASSFFSGVQLDDPPALEAEPKILYEHALDGEGPRGVDDALGIAGARGDEELLGGDVWVILHAVYRQRSLRRGRGPPG